MKPIIRVENLSKQYTIGGAQEPYATFRESLISAARLPLNIIKRRAKENGDNRFWALKDVNFEVAPGEVVGIIGRNGAGKSTLLKILSRITEPTRGRIELYGRVGSLLEVGTGFHPELTGRENIYLNGAILGMHREEINKKFDEIVDFAEIEEFLDTPVKRYSSGMYTRLAFAVAANLEPEILIVDEVLAVGDAEFQKKCLGKMKSVSQNEGRTVLFVSHNMSAVQNLCTKAVFLQKGKIAQIGDVQTVVNNYLAKGVAGDLKQEWLDHESAPGNEFVKIKRVEVVPEYKENQQDAIDVRVPLNVFIELLNLEANQLINVSIQLYNDKGDCVMALSSSAAHLEKGAATAHLKIPGNFLNDGSYYLSVVIVKDRAAPIYILEEAVSFNVDDYRVNTSWYGKWIGVVRPTFMPFTLTQTIGD